MRANKVISKVFAIFFPAYVLGLTCLQRDFKGHLGSLLLSYGVEFHLARN